MSSIRLVYDGDCAFCLRVLRIASRLDLFGRLQFYNARDRDVVQRRFPMLPDDLDQAIYAVDSDQRVYRGFYAFRRLAWASPLTWAFLPFFYMPGSTLIGPRVYSWVARHRYRLGCRSTVCQAPLGEDAGRSSSRHQNKSL